MNNRRKIAGIAAVLVEKIKPDPMDLGKNLLKTRENREMAQRSFFWLLVVAFVCYAGVSIVNQFSEKPLQTPYAKMRCLSTDVLLQKMQVGTYQEKVDASYILGVERSNELKEEYIPILLKALESDFGALGFQSAYAIEQMGAKAHSAIPAIKKRLEIEIEKNGILQDRLRDALKAISK